MTEAVKEKVETVHITWHNVDKETINLSISRGDQAEWITDTPVWIKFVETPFEHPREFEIESKSLKSGPIKANAKLRPYKYKYSIVWNDGFELDPHVIIDP